MRRRPSGESGPPVATIVRRLPISGRRRARWKAASARSGAGATTTVAASSAAMARRSVGAGAARMMAVPSSSAANQGQAGPTTRSLSSGRRSACSSRSASGRISVADGQRRLSGAASSAGSASLRDIPSRLNERRDPPVVRSTSPSRGPPCRARRCASSDRRANPATAARKMAGRSVENRCNADQSSRSMPATVRSQCMNAQAFVATTCSWSGA